MHTSMCGMHSIPAGVHVCGTYTGMITLLLINTIFNYGNLKYSAIRGVDWLTPERHFTRATY
jgi:hypothetical protein